MGVLEQTSEVLLTVLVSVSHGRRPPDVFSGRPRGRARDVVVHESRTRDCIAGTGLARLLLGARAATRSPIASSRFRL